MKSSGHRNILIIILLSLPLFLFSEASQAHYSKRSNYHVFIGENFYYDVQPLEGSTVNCIFSRNGVVISRNCQYEKTAAFSDSDVTYRLALSGTCPGRCTWYTSPSNFEITVYSKLVIKSNPQEVQVQQGGTAVLTAEIEGENLSYRWFSEFYGRVRVESTTSTLTLENVSESDEKKYFLRASNRAGSIITKLAAVRIISPPIISQQPQNSIATVGTSFSLSIEAKATPSPTYQWFKGDTKIDGATSATFTIENVNWPSRGTYRVEVKNSEGMIMSEPAILSLNGIGRMTADAFRLERTGGMSFESIEKMQAITGGK